MERVASAYPYLEVSSQEILELLNMTMKIKMHSSDLFEEKKVTKFPLENYNSKHGNVLVANTETSTNSIIVNIHHNISENPISILSRQNMNLKKQLNECEDSKASLIEEMLQYQSQIEEKEDEIRMVRNHAMVLNEINHKQHKEEVNEILEQNQILEEKLNEAENIKKKILRNEISYMKKLSEKKLQIESIEKQMDQMQDNFIKHKKTCKFWKTINDTITSIISFEKNSKLEREKSQEKTKHKLNTFQRPFSKLTKASADAKTQGLLTHLENELSKNDSPKYILEFQNSQFETKLQSSIISKGDTTRSTNFQNEFFKTYEEKEKKKLHQIFIAH
ncbi:hypothetical protein O181_014787 [Austropuccinia psidii MF-1]|uniref:Uncharacterized protein n=1 Tax=Austropuccinia psidii MF-1 TaxID=1389203 RepID=A0A9Q3C0V8_9BASI|nr:hypothetical protein [Austropuccinia psidii MF-1]